MALATAVNTTTKSRAFGYLADFVGGVVVGAGVVTGFSMVGAGVVTGFSTYDAYTKGQGEPRSAHVSKTSSYEHAGDVMITTEKATAYIIDEHGVKSDVVTNERVWSTDKRAVKAHLDSTLPAYKECMVDITKFKAAQGDKATSKFWELRQQAHPKSDIGRLDSCLTLTKEWWRTALFLNDEFREFAEGKPDRAVYKPMYEEFVGAVKPFERFQSQAENDNLFVNPMVGLVNCLVRTY